MLGIVTLGAVIWLGYLTANNSTPQIVAVFGIASAIGAPIGFALIGYAFTSSEQEIIHRLAKVPEIEKLITEANSQEEKIWLLEKQKQQLAEIIQFEAKRQTLVNRKENNERDAVRLLNELIAIDAELSILNITVNKNKEVAEALNALHERIDAHQRGAIVFTLGDRTFVVEAEFIRSLPWGVLIYYAIRFNQQFTNWATSEVEQIIEKRNHSKKSIL